MATKTAQNNGTSSDASMLLNFISDTKEGKYTQQKPELIQVTYQRIETDEHKSCYPTDEAAGMALFGLTF